MHWSMDFKQIPRPLTPEWISGRVAEIERVSGDDEEAHSLEDALHRAVLIAIAEGWAEEPDKCALAALLTIEVVFARWCA